MDPMTAAADMEVDSLVGPLNTEACQSSCKALCVAWLHGHDLLTISILFGDVSIMPTSSPLHICSYGPYTHSTTLYRLVLPVGSRLHEHLDDDCRLQGSPHQDVHFQEIRGSHQKEGHRCDAGVFHDDHLCCKHGQHGRCVPIVSILCRCKP